MNKSKFYIIGIISALILICIFFYKADAQLQDDAAVSDLVAILKQNNVAFKDDHIFIPEWVQHIKLDVGLSYNAPMTQKWLEKEDNLLVFAFEPNPVAVTSILNPNNVAMNGHEKALENHYINKQVFIIPVALGEQHSTMDFYVAENDIGCSSLYKPKSNFTNIKNVIKVDCFTLHTFFKLLPWGQIDYIEYLKIDAQGHDLAIVKGLGDYIAKIVYITLEAESSTYEGCEANNLANITQYMHSKNFAYVKHPNTKDPTFINKELAHKFNVFIEQ